MVFPNRLFPSIPLRTEISDEEYRMFHTIDRKLISTLIHSLGRNSFDAINVVAFLLWLERNRLSVNAVYKVNLDWPGHLVDMLADQVVALLEWLKNPVLVWEMRGDISLIQELCNQNVGFVYLHQRRLEILKEKAEIVVEMSERAFRDKFPEGGFVDRNVHDGVGFGSVGGAVYVPREVENRNSSGVQSGSASRYVHGPQVLGNNIGVQSAAGPVYVPRELQSYNHDGAGFEVRGRYMHDPRELVYMKYYAAGGLVHGRLIHDSRQLENNNIHNGVGFQTVDRRFIHDPRQLNNMNHNGLGYGTVSGLVQVHREPENMNGGGAGGFGTVGGLVQGHQGAENMDGGGPAGGFVNEPIINSVQILPNVPFGPRMGYVETDEGNPGNSRRSEMVNTRRPIPEDELSVLLSGLNIREEETDVPEDDRTVFLTFSRGYPITEPEIWGFFTRKFGNFIKAIHFEEVPEGVQPLYARMVAQNTSILPLICDVNIRTKYVINGKHVWAKKYVRKNSTPPPRMASSPSNNPP